MLFYSALPNHLKDIQNNWLLKFQKSINTKQQKLREMLEKQLWCQIDIFAALIMVMMSNEVIVVNSLHNFRPITRVGVFIHKYKLFSVTTAKTYQVCDSFSRCLIKAQRTSVQVARTLVTNYMRDIPPNYNMRTSDKNSEYFPRTLGFLSHVIGHEWHVCVQLALVRAGLKY
jgi:hypothetical protein